MTPVWLEVGPCFGGLIHHQNKGQTGSRYIYIFLWHSTLQVTHPKELETAEAKGITSDPWDSENPKTSEKMEIWRSAWPGYVMNKDLC